LDNECAAFGAPSPATLPDYENCLTQQHGCRAELADAVDGGHELGPVGHHHDHPVARAHAPPGEVVGERVAQTVEILERPPLVGPDGIAIAEPAAACSNRDA
jgi:hypothetical protein